MSPAVTKTEDYIKKLLPHQITFVKTVFNPASKHVILLCGDVGLGKSTALVALAVRQIQERPMARVLFLVPGLLRPYFTEKLQDAGAKAQYVDRYYFRKLLDSATGGEIWPRGVVLVLSRDFAKQSDILDSLAGVHWDLVIADEAHSMRGARAEALRRIAASAQRVVLTIAPALEPADVVLSEDATFVEWRRDLVVDHDGAPLDALPKPLFHEVAYHLSSAELNLFETVSALCRTFETGTSAQVWMAKSLLRRLQSSPAAIEGMLQRLAEGLETPEGMDFKPEALEEEMPEDRLVAWIDRLTAEEAAGIAGHALQEIEELGGDSKLSAFGGLINHLNEPNMPNKRICVLTDYLGTLYYLSAEIEGLGMQCQILHGGIGAEDRHRSLMRFSTGGWVLVATMAATTEGVALCEVTDLVLYDVPGSKVALQQVLGRFQRFGRRIQLNIHVLTPSNGSNGLIAEPIAFLRDLLGPLTREQTGY